MTTKNRCNCFGGEINTMLAGLRREGPSTERSTLERLVNLLSRAAVQNKEKGNPQKVWTKELQPSWWTEVTDLKWKNPREHPKDKKDDLRKKVRILHTKLTELKLMSKVLEEEYRLSENSKRAEIELKSDFEAIIAKVSGLHCMMENALKKLKGAKALSEKISSYVRQISSCFGKSGLCVKDMESVVDASEKQKDKYWISMGVTRPDKQRKPSAKKVRYDTFLSGVGTGLFEEQLGPEPDPEILMDLSGDDSSEGESPPLKSKPDSTTKSKVVYADSSQHSHERPGISALETMRATRDLVSITMDEGDSSMAGSASKRVSRRPSQSATISASSSDTDQFIPLDSLTRERSQKAHLVSTKISVHKAESIKKGDKNSGNDVGPRLRPRNTVVSTGVLSPVVLSDDSLDDTDQTVWRQKIGDIAERLGRREKSSWKPHLAEETATRQRKTKSPRPAEEPHQSVVTRARSDLAAPSAMDSSSDATRIASAVRDLGKSRAETATKSRVVFSDSGSGQTLGPGVGDIVWVTDNTGLADVVEIIDESPAPTVDMYVNHMDVDCGLGRDTPDHQHIPSCEEILPSVEGIIMDGLAKVATPDVPAGEDAAPRDNDFDKSCADVGRKPSKSPETDTMAKEPPATTGSGVREMVDAAISERVPASKPETHLRQKTRTESLSAAIGAEMFL